MARKICEFRDGKRCRKTATTAIAYKVLWAQRVGPHGEEPLYLTRITYRCPDHDAVEGETSRVTLKQGKAA